MVEWLQMVDDEAGHAVGVMFAAVIAFFITIQHAVVVRRLRHLVARAQIRHVEWFAEALNVDPCEVLRLHPTMRCFREDDERIEPQRAAQLLEYVDVDLPAAS